MPSASLIGPLRTTASRINNIPMLLDTLRKKQHDPQLHCALYGNQSEARCIVV